MQIALAPMEGLVDAPMRELVTDMGGVDWCVTEFVRVTDSALPWPTFRRLAPEHASDWRTRAGVPVRLQLLGSDPERLAENALRAVSLGAPVIDLNFGCPAPTVNKHRGGAALLQEPALMQRIVGTVRQALPADVPLTAKMRLGFADTSLTFDCAQALEDGGAAAITVHARTKLDGYRPPAHWEWIARIRERVSVPVIANGDVWTVNDWQRIRAVSGCEDVMIGRGLVARPDLARQIRAAANGEAVEPLPWAEMLVWIAAFAERLYAADPDGQYLPARLKQWLKLLRLPSGWPDEAGRLFDEIRPLKTAAACRQWLAAATTGR